VTGTPKKTSLACNAPDPYVCLRETNLTSEMGSKQEVSRHNRRVRLDLISGPKSGIAARQLGAINRIAGQSNPSRVQGVASAFASFLSNVLKVVSDQIADRFSLRNARADLVKAPPSIGRLTALRLWP
jgi:hypothetical protein